MQKKIKPVIIRAAMLEESKGNTELCLMNRYKGKTKILTSTSCWLPG